ncbi:MAG: hypothetical protein AAF984_09660 [Verrucomicrobiota bacterium]
MKLPTIVQVIDWLAIKHVHQEHVFIIAIAMAGLSLLLATAGLRLYQLTLLFCVYLTVVYLWRNDY